MAFNYMCTKFSIIWSITIFNLLCVVYFYFIYIFFFFFFDRPDCRYCTRLDTSGRISSLRSGREYSSKMNVSCQSSNLIYCITCKRCGIQYVGQTKRRVMDRFQDHFYKITKALMDTDIGKHFNTNKHGGLDDVQIHIVDFIHCSPESSRAAILRNIIEKKWIFRLRTQCPEGLNLIDVPFQ